MKPCNAYARKLQSVMAGSTGFSYMRVEPPLSELERSLEDSRFSESYKYKVGCQFIETMMDIDGTI